MKNVIIKVLKILSIGKEIIDTRTGYFSFINQIAKSIQYFSFISPSSKYVPEKTTLKEKPVTEAKKEDDEDPNLGKNEVRIALVVSPEKMRRSIQIVSQSLKSYKRYKANIDSHMRQLL